MSEVFLHWTTPEGRQVVCFKASEEEAQKHQALLEGFKGKTCTNFRIETLEPCLEHFTRLVESHDLTFTYSDDHRAYMNGMQSIKRIRTMAGYLQHGDVVRIWNAMVDKCLVEDAREQFYWQD